MKQSQPHLWDQQQLEQMPLDFKVHLINSITGIKPANLVATESSLRQTNLALFSSVVHLGSQPPLLGMMLRPAENGNRHTYQNILSTGHYSINAVTMADIDKAHWTSARFEQEISEFAACGFEEQRYAQFDGVFVKHAPIQIGLKYREEHAISANHTRLIVGEVVFVALNAGALDLSGQLNLEQMELAGISGLNRYYGLELQAQFDAAKTENSPKNQNTK